MLCKIEIVEQSSQEVFTNSPEMLQGAPEAPPPADDESLEVVEDEEMVE